MNDQSDKLELLARCRQGDQAAFACFYELHQRRVFSVALNFFGGRREIAEDITQQVFLKIFQKIPSFRAEAEVTTWIYRMTVNSCVDEYRKRRRFTSFDNIVNGLWSRRSVDQSTEEKHVADQIRRAIGQLKEHYRLPILLKYSEGLSYEEIAGILNCSVGTVSSRMNRGHEQLAKRLRHLKGLVK